VAFPPIDTVESQRLSLVAVIRKQVRPQPDRGFVAMQEGYLRD
jgi:hypothetical protein